MYYATNHGVRLYYEDDGPGPGETVLFLEGLSCGEDRPVE